MTLIGQGNKRPDFTSPLGLSLRISQDRLTKQEEVLKKQGEVLWTLVNKTDNSSAPKAAESSF